MKYLCIEYTCLKDKNNKIKYIGFTSRALSIRFKEHCRKFPERKKYHIELIEETEDKEIAKQKEIYYTLLYNTIEDGDNINLGMGQSKSNKGSFQKGNTFGKKGTKKVKCLETNEVFNSLTECANYFNLSISKISAVCQGKRKTTGKKHFIYYSEESLSK